MAGGFSDARHDAGLDSKDHYGGNRGGGGGVGPHGGRSQGGVGSATPGGWGFGGNLVNGGLNYGGPRRQTTNIATRPATFRNIGVALGSALPGASLMHALHAALTGNLDPYEGPVGQAHMSGADTPGSMLGGQRLNGSQLAAALQAKAKPKPVPQTVYSSPGAIQPSIILPQVI